MSIIKNILRRYIQIQNETNPKPNDLRLAIAQAFKVNQTILKWSTNNNILISIGENCNASWYLKETGNKQASFPFDWLFTAPEIIYHIVDNDFKTFLDKELIIEKSNKKSAGHKFYHSSLFNHRNPLKGKNDYSYYERCVLRFKNIINNHDNKIIFVCNVIVENEKRIGWASGFNKNFKEPKNQDVNTFSKLISLLKRKNSNSKFIFIEQKTEEDFYLNIEYKTKDILWIRYNSIGENDGVKYINKFDDFIAKIIYSGLNDKITKE